MIVIIDAVMNKSKNNPPDQGEIEKLMKVGAEIAGMIFSSKG
jgi:hypothetical protein